MFSARIHRSIVDSSQSQVGVLKMRRKKCRPAFSFRNKCIVDAMTNLWICLVYFYFIAICACNDSAGTTSASTNNGGQTPVYSQSPSSASQTPHNFTNAELNSIDASISNYTSPKFGQRKQTFVRSGNELWDSLIDECLQKPTFSCFQKNVYTYLDNTLKLDDVNVTDRIIFKKIDIDPNTMLQLQNDTDEENEILKEESRVFESGWCHQFAETTKCQSESTKLIKLNSFFSRFVFRITN